MKNEMTPRERIMAAINHKPVDRVPTDYWGTGEASAKLRKGLGVNNDFELFNLLGIDKIMGVWPAYIGPPSKTPVLGERADMWGIESKPVKYADGEGTYWEMCLHPLEKYETIDEIEANYVWPKADWFDFTAIAEQCKRNPDYAVDGGYTAPFFYYNNIRGLEQSLIDLASGDEIADYIIGKICDFFYEYHKRLYDAAGGGIDMTQLTDDFGTQAGLMISVDMFNRYFKDHYIKFAKLIKSYGIKIFHHDDGSIMPLIPTLEEIGVDIINPVQWHLPGMDIKELKCRFGKKICFHGGIDNQFVLPFGTKDDVRNEVAACIETLASDGTGYILAPCHSIQCITPVENVVEMYKAARELGMMR